VSKKLLDSSVWIELLGSRPLGKACQAELKNATEVIVPSLVLFEVYKKIAQLTTEDNALSALALMNQNSIVNLDQEIALTAADLSMQHKLGMADSLILAHAQKAGATLITLDHDFMGLHGVKILRA